MMSIRVKKMEKTYREMVLGNMKMRRDKREEFFSTFNVPLSKYMDLLTGFDIIKFDDEVVKPPDGKSMEETILSTYGQKAVELIESLPVLP